MEFVLTILFYNAAGKKDKQYSRNAAEVFANTEQSHKVKQLSVLDSVTLMILSVSQLFSPSCSTSCHPRRIQAKGHVCVDLII